jgi:FkbM family methyltransferase
MKPEARKLVQEAVRDFASAEERSWAGAEKLWKASKELGAAQREIAKEMGVSQMKVSRYIGCWAVHLETPRVSWREAYDKVRGGSTKARLASLQTRPVPPDADEPVPEIEPEVALLRVLATMERSLASAGALAGNCKRGPEAKQATQWLDVLLKTGAKLRQQLGNLPAERSGVGNDDASVRAAIERDGMLDGIHCRPEDSCGVREARSQHYARLAVQPGDTVLDLGGCIGTFARWAVMDRGVKRVVSVEPLPANAELYRKNTEGLPCTLIPGGVGISEVFTHRVFSRTGFTPGKSDKGWTRTECRELSLRELVEEHHPDVVKCDIESAEFKVLTEYPELGTARALALEVHYDRPLPKRTEQAKRMFAALHMAGWRTESGERPTPKESRTQLLFFTREAA